MYRDVTGQARDDSSPCPAADWFHVVGEMGSFLFKSPPSPWLGESGLALSVLLRDCLWLGEGCGGGEVRLSKMGEGCPGWEDVEHTIIASSWGNESW